MDEYVGKQAVIDEIEEWYELYPHSEIAKEALSLVKRSIKKLPPADVRPAVSPVEMNICKTLSHVLRFCARRPSGLGCRRCPYAPFTTGGAGCGETKLKYAAADAIERLLQEDAL